MNITSGITDGPKEILRQQEVWTSCGKSAEEFTKTALDLAGLFQKKVQLLLKPVHRSEP